MTKGKKLIFISIICVAVITFATVGLGFFIDSIIPKTYSSAKKECEKILNKYQVQMEEIAVNSLKSSRNVSGNFKEYFYSSYKKDGYVKFDISEQGMLGGQYWDLVYTADGTFNGETKSFLYKQTSGNDIIRAEKINEHWWYLWTDYDGTKRSYK